MQTMTRDRAARCVEIGLGEQLCAAKACASIRTAARATRGTVTITRRYQTCERSG